LSLEFDDASGFITSRLTLKKQGITLPDLDLLETILAYKFKNRALLERAVTHRSWAHEQVAPGAEDQARQLHNEALEFLGLKGLVVMPISARLTRAALRGNPHEAPIGKRDDAGRSFVAFEPG
jgi:hypothetical protein